MLWENALLYLLLLVVLFAFHCLFLLFCAQMQAGRKIRQQQTLVVAGAGVLCTAVFLPFFYFGEQWAGLFCAALLFLELCCLLRCHLLWAAFLAEAFLLQFLSIYSAIAALLGHAAGGWGRRLLQQRTPVFLLVFLLLVICLGGFLRGRPVQWMLGAALHKKQLLLLVVWTALANLYMLFSFGFFVQTGQGPPVVVLLVVPLLILASFYAAVGVSAAISRILEYEEEPEEPLQRSAWPPARAGPFAGPNIWRYSYLSQLLSASETPYKTVYHVLSVLTNQYTFSRGYIFQVVPESGGLQNTFEWCDSGATAQIYQFLDVSGAGFPTITAAFKKHKMFIMEDPEVLSPEERAQLKNQNICSMLHFAFYENGRFMGFVGFDDCTLRRSYPIGMIHELRLFSQMLAEYLLCHPEIAREAAAHIAKGHPPPS